MNRYKSVSTCEAPGVAEALPAPAGHLWRGRSPLWPLPVVLFPVLWSAPSRGSNYPLNLYLQPQEAPGIRLCAFSKLIKRLAVWRDWYPLLYVISPPRRTQANSLWPAEAKVCWIQSGFLWEDCHFMKNGCTVWRSLWRLLIFSWAPVLRLHNVSLCTVCLLKQDLHLEDDRLMRLETVG